jgi:predicted Mrr-cat superfamily restriction endonuclease
MLVGVTANTSPRAKAVPEVCGLHLLPSKRKMGDKCLYVSTGSFSKDARYEAERASVPTTLIDLSDLRRLLVENYEKLDGETRALVPLKRFYWPMA